MNRFVCFALVSAISLVSLRAQDSSFVVAGYLPDYRMATWSKQTAGLTDVIYFGMSMQPDGVFDTSQVSPEHLAKLRQLKAKTNCRLLFTVGGWEKSAGFARLVSDQQRRTAFIEDAYAYCQRNGFDGIDFDWEHPEGAEQIEGLARLLRETHAKFSPNRLIVTIAQAGWQDLGKDVYDSVDRVHLMAYDHSFPQATIPKAKQDVQRLIAAGCPRNKIVLGLPFYGRDKSENAKTYAQLLPQASDPASDVVNGFAFNSADTITAKTRMAKQGKLAGVMIWELGQDATGDRSLLNAIRSNSK